MHCRVRFLLDFDLKSAQARRDMYQVLFWFKQSPYAKYYVIKHLFLKLSFTLFFLVCYGAVHKLCRLGGEGGDQKFPNLLSRKTTKRGEGVKNCLSWDNIVYGLPFIFLGKIPSKFVNKVQSPIYSLSNFYPLSYILYCTKLWRKSVFLDLWTKYLLLIPQRSQNRILLRSENQCCLATFKLKRLCL